MGSAKERFDDRGNEKVQCRECNLWFHRLDVHIERKHGNVSDYQAKYPSAPLLSDRARNVDKRNKGKAVREVDDTSYKFGVARLKERDDLNDYDKLWVPKHDEDWTLGSDESEHLEALALAIEDDENILITGPPGIGKTTLVKEIGAICNHPLRRTSFRGDMRASDLIGTKSLKIDSKTGQSYTDYEGALLQDAIERGHWLLVDEIDGGPAEVMFILFPVLEEDRSLLLMGKEGGSLVNFDPRFRFIGTMNTQGFGDETGLFAGTNSMNEALLDRFATVIKMKYPSKENEIERIEKKSGIDRATAKKMVDVGEKVREAQLNDTTTASLSPRRLIMWARKTVRLNNPRKAAKYTITNRLTEEDSVFVDSIIQRIFGGAI